MQVILNKIGLWSQVIMFICKYMFVLKDLSLMAGITVDYINWEKSLSPV